MERKGREGKGRERKGKEGLNRLVVEQSIKKTSSYIAMYV